MAGVFICGYMIIDVVQNGQNALTVRNTVESDVLAHYDVIDHDAVRERFCEKLSAFTHELRFPRALYLAMSQGARFV